MHCDVVSPNRNETDLRLHQLCFRNTKEQIDCCTFCVWELPKTSCLICSHLSMAVPLLNHCHLKKETKIWTWTHEQSQLRSQVHTHLYWLPVWLFCFLGQSVLSSSANKADQLSRGVANLVISNVSCIAKGRLPNSWLNKGSLFSPK